MKHIYCTCCEDVIERDHPYIIWKDEFPFHDEKCLGTYLRINASRDDTKDFIDVKGYNDEFEAFLLEDQDAEIRSRINKDYELDYQGEY